MKEQNLTLVGLSEDKQKLVLVSDAGEEFVLPADARLRAALRGDHARLGQLEITMDSALRPRDIQARIRAGESPEQVATAAQTTLDRVIGYATPVLAERAHIAERAQRASIRRRSGEGPSGVLADAVAERLRGRNVDPSGVEWDAWRREDGRWTIVADYRSGDSERHAEFLFDAPGRYVVADDDEARWLVGEQTAVRGPQPRATPGPRRLSAVDGPGDRGEDELPLGEDAIEMVSDPEPTPDPAVGARGTGDADWMATQASERPAAAQELPYVETDQAEESAQEISPVELGSEADEPTDPEPQVVAAPEDAAQTGASDADSEPAARGSRRGRRPSVPSWDEIMFGGGKGD